jgi:hypothetical protein
MRLDRHYIPRWRPVNIDEVATLFRCGQVPQAPHLG